jgi:hypothetical protein
MNYSAINIVLQKINLIPEYLIILIGPIIMPFILFFIFLFDNFYLIYLWFSNFGWFFKENENAQLNENENKAKASDLPPKWKYVTLEEPLNYAWCLFIAFIFFILFWFVLFLALPVLPFITLTICVVSCLLYKGQINKDTVYSHNIVEDVFKYYKVPIMIIISLFCIKSAFTNINAITGVLSIFFILSIYFDFINMSLFKQIIPANLSYPLASNNVATKSSVINTVASIVNTVPSVFNAIPYSPLQSNENNNNDQSTEKKALTGGGKSNFVKKLKKISSQ